MLLWIIEVIELKGEKIRVVIIYLLVVLIFLLVGYLIYNFFINTNGSKPKEEAKKESEISKECTFDVKLADYNSIIRQGSSDICGGINKINITDATLDGKNLDLEVRYYNGSIDESDNGTGIYIGGKRVTQYASSNYQNKFGIFDNMIFIFTSNSKEVNVAVYDSLKNKVYDLENALLKNNISDPAFTEIAKTNPGLNVILKTSNIDRESFNFGSNEFSFSSTLNDKCTAGQNIGSTYKVTFGDGNFSNPEFVSYNVCKG